MVIDIGASLLIPDAFSTGCSLRTFLNRRPL